MMPSCLEDLPQLFHCLHCHGKTGKENEFRSVQDVYNHWTYTHNDDMNTRPFHYYMTEYGGCHHCDYIASYYELMKHHKEKHLPEPFVIIDMSNYQKCALCSYIGTDVPKHFAVHRIYAKNFRKRHIARMWSPICMTDETYDERWLKKLHRKFKCNECGAIIETDFLLRHHFITFHKTPTAIPTARYNAKDCFDLSRYYLCGCCNKKVEIDAFMEHMKNHIFQFPCAKCPFTFTDLVDLIVHDYTNHDMDNTLHTRIIQYSNHLQKYYYSTRMIHGNGLVLTKQNLLSTKYDDWSEFSDYIESMVRFFKFRYRKLKSSLSAMKRNKFTQTDFEPRPTVAIEFNATIKIENSEEQLANGMQRLSIQTEVKNTKTKFLNKEIRIEVEESMTNQPPKKQKKKKKRTFSTQSTQTGGLVTSV